MAELGFVLYVAPQHYAVAIQWKERLAQLHVQIELNQVEQINARFLRQHSALSLVVDEQGLWLAANGMKMQPAWHEEIHRLKRASLKSELIARACQLNKVDRVLDATAGLGHDALLMAWLGAKVTLLERHPVLFSLLQSSLEQAKAHPLLADTTSRMQLLYTDAAEYLQNIAPDQFDTIYLDPMFPARDANQKQDKKQAQVKKQMQLLHLLLPSNEVMDLGESLLILAQSKCKRVIVKRPKHAIYLADQPPQHQWQGDACRFDGYFVIPSLGNL